MLYEWNQLLATAIRSYRIGLLMPDRMSAGTRGELFASQGQAFIRQRLEAAELARYVQLREDCQRAVQHVHDGQPDASRTAFAEVLANIDQFTSREGRLLGHSWIYQGMAFLETRQGDWDAARHCLQQAMESDTRLEEDHGYDLFHIARVHVVHLWLRVEAHAGNKALAVSTCQAIFDYLDGTADSLPFGNGWGRQRAADVPDDLRAAMRSRIASEIGALLAPLEFSEAASLFPHFTAWQRFENDEQLAEIFLWGQCKAAFLKGDTTHYLNQVVQLLATGRGVTTLWHTALLDLSRCCRTLRQKATRPFRVELSEDAEAWPDLPVGGLRRSLLKRLQALAQDALPEQEKSHAVYLHVPQPRQFRAYNVGLPRTGTSSMCTLLANYRSGNEFMEAETIRKLIARHKGEIDADAFGDYLKRRDLEGNLEMDSSSFNHFYIDHLVEHHPEARFIFTLREPYAWVGSYLKMLNRWYRKFTDQGRPLPHWMEDYGRLLFGNFSWHAFATPESFSTHLPELVEGFVKHWGQANRRILSALPRDRSLLVRTSRLSESLEAIAGLLGIAVTSLTEEHHSNRSDDRTDPLADLDSAWFETLCRNQAQDILEVLETCE